MWHRELRIDVMTTLNKKKPSLIISKMKDSKILVVLAVLGIHLGRHLLGPGVGSLRRGSMYLRII